ncbi:hypothetical protein ABDK00_012725 [Niabella insulamsoli]|uniref:hypothetical protein n=1 Tax=Niabella insulamsoli TaxID=3144874 RepID=UPI0031FD7974
MRTVTPTSHFDQLQVADEEVILNGPPSNLKGQIVLNNDTDERLRVKALPIQPPTKGLTSSAGDQPFLNIPLRIGSKEKRATTVFHQVNPHTPPGIYESILHAGGKKRKLKLVVQPSVKIDIQPRQLTFQGTAPQTKHTALITLSNTGNMPFQVPEVKHVTTLDMDYLCRASSLAIKSKAATDGYAAFMDEVTRHVHSSLTEALKATIKESGMVLQPGEVKVIQLSLVLPKNTDGSRDYAGGIRIWNQVISYSIKSFIEK